MIFNATHILGGYFSFKRMLCFYHGLCFCISNHSSSVVLGCIIQYSTFNSPVVHHPSSFQTWLAYEECVFKGLRCAQPESNRFHILESVPNKQTRWSDNIPWVISKRFHLKTESRIWLGWFRTLQGHPWLFTLEMEVLSCCVCFLRGKQKLLNLDKCWATARITGN